MARRDGAWGARTGSRISDLDAAAAWMTRLHRVHRFGVRAWDGRAADDVVCRSIDAYSRQFGVTDSERFLFRRVMERAVEFRGDLPVVWEHGDYTVWNLFRRAGTSSDPADSVGVLDWEGAGPGLPYVDLFRFAVHWTELASNDARRLGRRAMLARTLFGDATQVGSAARGALDRYLAAVGVDPSLEPVLITRLYVELAVRRHEIAVEGGVMPDHPRASNPAIDMVGHLASFADRW
jgi:aminoglycoside phosphotransferase (APT) family kinase protein